MKELSLHVLDIVQNAVKADASEITVAVSDEGAARTIRITDDGCGMDEAFLKNVTDPFTTTRTTRNVGLGLPLFKMAAEQTGGSFGILSHRGAEHGTEVTARFDTAHIDCAPMGDFAMTVVTLIQGCPDLHFVFIWRKDGAEKRMDTEEMRALLDGVPLDTPEVLRFITDYWNEAF